MRLVHPRNAEGAKVPLESRCVRVRGKMVFYRALGVKRVCQ